MTFSFEGSDLKKEVSQQRLRSGSYYNIVQKKLIDKYDFGPLHTYIDAEFHGEFIFERFRTIWKCVSNINFNRSAHFVGTS